MDEFKSEKRNTVCYIGMILIITGYVFLSNHGYLGNLVILTGALMILFKKLKITQNRTVGSDHPV